VRPERTVTIRNTQFDALVRGQVPFAVIGGRTLARKPGASQRGDVESAVEAGNVVGVVEK
jgi:hypothetical protein